MSIIKKFADCVARMDEDNVSLQEYINQNSVKSVTDVEVKTGVDRMLYNHSLNKSQIAAVCGTTPPTLNLIEKKLLSSNAVNEPFSQGASTNYNRFDVAVFMNEFKVPKYSDRYDPMTISIMQHKGGSGKSTTTRTLATAAALDLSLNANVVILDLDPQGSDALQCQPRGEDDVYLTIADIQLRDVEPDSPFYRYVEAYGLSNEDVVLSAAIPTHLPNLQIYPAFPDDERFTDFYHKLDEQGQSTLLRQLVDFIIPILKKRYDLIFIDTPPQDSPIIWSALKATDYMLTPLAPKALDYMSTKNFIRFTMDRIVQSGVSESLREWKVLPVMIDYNNRSHLMMMDRYRWVLADRMFSNAIELSELFYAADNLQRTVYDIQKQECKDNKYTSPNQYDLALKSSTAVYTEFKNQLLLLAGKNRNK